MIDEGYVKYDCQWQHSAPPEGIEELISVRNALYAMGLIGKYEPSGIGFGNVSMRHPDGRRFFISGTSTGGIEIAEAIHFCTVDAWDIHRNSLVCEGPVAASSESLTHAMLYDCAPGIQAILHVHHLAFWEKLLESAPCTSAEVAYGTPEMALEMKRLLEETGYEPVQIFAMKGHDEGILVYGRSLPEAIEKIVAEFRKMFA